MVAPLISPAQITSNVKPLRRALVLSGGGARGSFQVGALKALTEAGKRWDSVHGISVGALNAAWFAMHKKEDHPFCMNGLLDIWNGVHSSADIYKPWIPFKYPNYIWSLWKGSLNSGAPLRKLVDEFWNPKRIEESGVHLTVGCCSLQTSEYHAISSNRTHPGKMKEYILASSHLPAIFEPLKIDGQQWMDGGMRHQIPILEALKELPDEIDVILTSPMSSLDRVRQLGPLSGITEVGLRATEILSDAVYANDFFTVMRATKNFPGKINIYVPSTQSTHDSMNFDYDFIQLGIRTGYEETKVRLAREEQQENAEELIEGVI